LGHRRLHHRLALAARAGGSDVADNLEAAGYVLQYLGHALADLAQLAAAAGFAHAGRRVHDVAARQPGRQLTALLPAGGCRAGRDRRSVGDLLLVRRRGWRGSLRRCRLDLLERQLELLDAALDALRARAELLPAEPGELGLQLLGLQRLLDQAGLGRGELGRACREHRLALGQERVLGNELPPKLLDLSAIIAASAHGRRIYTASRSSCEGRLPRALWGAPIDAFQQHRQLCRGERDGALLRHRPHEAALLQPLGEQAEALPVPVENLDEIAALAAEGEQVAGKWVLLQYLLRHHTEAVETAAHVGRTARQIDAHTGRHGDHERSPSMTASRRPSASGSMPSSTLMTRPFASLISTAPLRRLQVGAAAAVGWAGAGSDGVDMGLARPPSLASGRRLTGANVARASGLSDSPGIRPSRTCRSH